MPFKPDEAFDSIIFGVTLEGLGPMLVDALDEVRRDAGVEGPVLGPRKDIDAGIAFHRRMKRQGRPRVKPGVTKACDVVA